MAMIITPTNKLKEKTGSGGFTKDSIKQAQETIDDNEIDFEPIATTYLQNVREAFESHRKEQDDKKLHSELLDQLTQIRAQGSMFGYPSLSELTDTVVDLLDSMKSIDQTAIEIVLAYETSAQTLLNNKIKDNKDKICTALVDEMLIVCEKYKYKNKNKNQD